MILKIFRRTVFKWDDDNDDEVIDYFMNIYVFYYEIYLYLWSICFNVFNTKEQ